MNPLKMNRSQRKIRLTRLHKQLKRTAAKVRKRAGLPELVADALPSTVAMKMMILFLNLSKFSRIENKTLSMLISFAH